MHRTTFSSRLGIIAASVGASVGLGNIWRFPYTLGESGGAAFLLAYLGFVLLLGIPVMLSEFVMGRSTQKGPVDAYQTLASKQSIWSKTGWLGVFAAFLVLGFYTVVAGWTLYYFFLSLGGALKGITPEGYGRMFTQFSGDPILPTICFIIFLSMTLYVTYRGIKNGIEKVSNILTPLLFLFLVVLAIRGLMLPNSFVGLEFLFKPDFSKLNSKVLLSALGQSFFSLSIGLGALTTYASYFRKDLSLVRTAFWVAGLDTLVAILAGVMIFPAVFSFGINPSEGANLVFITLPNVFQQMLGGQVWSSIFFLLLVIAALTSTISLAETIATCMKDHFDIGRKRAMIYIFAAEIVLGTLCSLSFGPLKDVTLFGMTIFSIFDYVANNLLLPLGGLFVSLFVGWRLDRSILVEELSRNSKVGKVFIGILLILLRYVAPVFIFLIILSGLGFVNTEF